MLDSTRSANKPTFVYEKLLDERRCFRGDSSKQDEDNDAEIAIGRVVIGATAGGRMECWVEMGRQEH
jgi:hypothetical protein